MPRRVDHRPRNRTHPSPTRPPRRPPLLRLLRLRKNPRRRPRPQRLRRHHRTTRRNIHQQQNRHHLRHIPQNPRHPLRNPRSHRPLRPPLRVRSQPPPQSKIQLLPPKTSHPHPTQSQQQPTNQPKHPNPHHRLQKTKTPQNHTHKTQTLTTTPHTPPSCLLHCTVDDFLPERTENARRRISDAELITLCIAQAMMGMPSQSAGADLAKDRREARVPTTRRALRASTRPDADPDRR